MSGPAFPPNSRYAATPTAQLTMPDGRVVTYLRRRFVPPPESLATLGYHLVEAGDRPDLLADSAYGDAEQSWRICDANAVLHPDELTDDVGAEIRIGLPAGLPGAGDAKGIHLTLLIGPTIPVPVPREVTDAFESAQVTVTATERSGFQLVFRYSARSMISTALLPSGFFDPNTRVILIATTDGIPSVVSDGIVTQQQVAPSSSPGQSTLTVTGEDVTLAMDLVDKTGIVTYPALSPSNRVRLILAQYALYGVVPLVLPGMSEETPIPTDRTFAHEGTDLAYVKKLADETGYVFFVEPGPAPGMNLAYWGPQVRISPPQPALSIAMDAATNVDTLSFTYNGLGRTQVAITILEPTSKIAIPIPLPDISPLAPPLALRQATALKFEFLRGAARQSPIAAMARGVGKVAELANAIAGQGSLDIVRYGRPLRARQLVGVRGAGLAYDGLYFVKSVTTNLKPGEGKQTFTLVRNGLVSLTPLVPT